MMLPHHGALDKLKLFHLEDGGFHHQRDYKTLNTYSFLLALPLKKNKLLVNNLII
ncbi:hypothetical protein N3Z16_10595 (plasmid) [Candidatus Megaera polyxenophila]|uniref:hypothetical protein n=1 Tax=Candidatus Megaera polyxenophila TaxID=988779 RepID=UPI00249EA27E|nr:hypothetical protein N3Z16_10595 [Candidatus Megaera polyxenophila]